MYKLKLLSLATLVSVALFFVSCSDDKDDNNNPNNPQIESMKDYFPGEEGSNWIYANWEVDENGNKISILDYDTVKVTSRVMMGGVNAYELTTFNSEFGNMGEEYYDIKDRQLFGYTSFDIIEGTEETWMKMIDLDQNEWTAFEQDLDDMEFFGFPLTDVEAKVISKFIGNKDVQIKGKTYAAKDYSFAIEMKARTVFNGFPVPVQLNVTTINTFAKGIGRTHTIDNNFSATVAGIPIEEIFGEGEEQENGEMSELIDFEIVK